MRGWICSRRFALFAASLFSFLGFSSTVSATFAPVMSSPAMRPFYGTMMPAPVGYGMTGQMQMRQQQYVDTAPLYVSNHFNWTGSQPMGGSYMPPVGLSSILNSSNYNGFYDRYYGAGSAR